MPEAPIMELEVWWDWQQRLWVVQAKDTEGNQIDEASWWAHKKDAVLHASTVVNWINAQRHKLADMAVLTVGTRRSG